MSRLHVFSGSGALLVLVAAGLCGCGGSDRPQTVGAGGVVTYRGKPLANAEVVFAPEDQGRVANGKTDENGRFRLGTFAPGDGALVGKHRVAIIARGPAKKPAPGSPAALMPDDYEPVGEPLIPAKYFTAATSGLTAEVKASGGNEFEFKLTD